MPWGVAVAQGWCASITFLFPFPALPGGIQWDWALQPWLGRVLTPQSSHRVTPLLKQLTAVIRGGCIQAMAAAGWGFWQELPTGAWALALCQCDWFKVTLPGKLYTWNTTDTCPPGKSVKTRVPITQGQHTKQWRFLDAADIRPIPDLGKSKLTCTSTATPG